MDNILLFPTVPPPVRIPVRGAAPRDIAQVQQTVGVIFNLTISALMGQLENLRENLPVGEVVFDDVYALLHDLRHETEGRLQKAAERDT